jgi:hypothetical protein
MKLRLPKWLRREAVSLPKWAKMAESHSPKVSCLIKADMDGAMKEWLDLLEVKEPDQYWLEAAYQCAKLDLQAALAGSPMDPRISGKPCEFHFSRAPQWALANFPKGKGPRAATQGKEARSHYVRIRGRMPM